MHLIRQRRAFETFSGLKNLPKNNGEKRVKSVKQYFYTDSATLNKGGKGGFEDCNYTKKSGRVDKKDLMV